MLCSCDMSLKSMRSTRQRERYRVEDMGLTTRDFMLFFALLRWHFSHPCKNKLDAFSVIPWNSCDTRLYSPSFSHGSAQDVSCEEHHITHQLTALSCLAYLHPCYGSIGFSSFGKAVFWTSHVESFYMPWITKLSAKDHVFNTVKKYAELTGQEVVVIITNN